MKYLTAKWVASLSFLIAVASCGSTPEVTRLNTNPQFVQEQNLKRLNRSFRRDVQATIHFAFNQDILSQEAIRILDAQAEWIIANPSIRFSVYGYTDKVGSSQYNGALGMRRALRVVAYLASRGVSGDRLDAQITFGEDTPVIDTEYAEVANRRATTFVAAPYVPVRTVRASAKRPTATPPVTTPPADTPPADTPLADTPPADTPPADTPPADTPPADTPPADTPPADTPPADTPPADTPPADTPPADTPPADTPPADTPPADTPPADTPPADTPPSGGPDAGKKDKDRVDAGRGNGSEEGGDPGNSGGHNQGGDELVPPATSD